MNTKIYIAIMAATGLALTGCITDAPGDEGQRQTASDPTTFTIEMPDTQTVETRYATTNENTVSSLWVLMCNADGTFVKAVQATVGTVTAATVDGDSAKLTASANIDFRPELYDLMFVANPPDVSKLGGLSAGMTRAQIQQTLQMVKTDAPSSKLPTYWNIPIEQIPMYGELHDVEIAHKNTPVSRTVTLRRALARVNVKVSEPRFRLHSVWPCNLNTRGQLVPDDASVTTAASIPDAPGKYSGITFGYEAFPIGGNKYGYTEIRDRIYIFEHKNVGRYGDANNADGTGWRDNTCLIIAGYYDSDNDGDFSDEGDKTCYRIDFVSGPDRQHYTWHDVVRNHSYNFNIGTISGHGFPDIESAFAAPPTNIDASLLVWDESDIRGRDIYGSTQYTINIAATVNGNVVAKYPYALEGMQISISAAGKPGYRFDRWTVTRNDNGAQIASFDAAANPATFTMPASNVTITPAFIEARFFDVAARNAVDMNGNTVGTATASPAEGIEPGERVTITAQRTTKHLDFGDFEKWRITRTDGVTDLTASLLPDATLNPATFTMPREDLIVTPVYRANPVTVDFVQKNYWSQTDSYTDKLPPDVRLIPQADAGKGATEENSRKALSGGEGVPAGTWVSYRLDYDTSNYDFSHVDIYDDTFDWTDAREWSTDKNNITFQLLPRTLQSDGTTMRGGRKIVVVMRNIRYKAQITVGQGLTVEDSDSNGHGNEAWYGRGNGIPAGEHVSYRVSNVEAGWGFDGWSATDMNGNAIAFDTNEPNPFNINSNMWFNMPEGGVKLYANSSPRYTTTVSSNVGATMEHISNESQNGMKRDQWGHVTTPESWNGWYFKEWHNYEGEDYVVSPNRDFWYAAEWWGDNTNITLFAEYVYGYKPNPVGEVALTSNNQTTIWAKTNVSSYGQFAANEWDEGEKFKWGIDGSALPTSAQLWPDDKNPCPAGWRLPSYQEWLNLMTAAGDRERGGICTLQGYIHEEWVNGVHGTRHAGVFMPNIGSSGAGYYWASMRAVMIMTTSRADSYGNYAPDKIAINLSGSSLNSTYPVRCVRNAQ